MVQIHIQRQIQSSTDLSFFPSLICLVCFHYHLSYTSLIWTFASLDEKCHQMAITALKPLETLFMLNHCAFCSVCVAWLRPDLSRPHVLRTLLWCALFCSSLCSPRLLFFPCSAFVFLMALRADGRRHISFSSVGFASIRFASSDH